ncbi:MAG: molybdopterin-guanine dinucleotide biosynthesis protein B [Deltaproteobacteria bacterium]|nr:molybdopterin-guanine dinucleotide biosynthesis protein B [Deltaproteobacteria bacterium]MBW1719461.1 molybdopterin-guanine dinucleotide biosynthesis protein B [Deltaproteobacteria bacterium]MBW1933184.1 molybdopterin-guanine dinucleotide biosynthesis protein B [Deltaproteobacteria bacterium]MBW1938648.1 molybdopterin-guanine dinucleotide biosynthesis protein B [Deltaproteobacteria bacterium]MBW1964930.1 molybdopterin-guanine dinucleotide biosynthesis protein B [Deltaproteobacteria bacterium
MTPILTFVGWHNSGKTTLVRKVVRRLRDKGYKIAVIKSTKHRGLNLDSPGSDSCLYGKDGIESVALICPDELILFQENTGEDLKHLAFRLFPDVDLVIGEGFKHASGIPKIEVTRADESKEPLRESISDVRAVVSDCEVSFDKVFKISQVAELTDFIENSFLNDNKDDMCLFVDGREISLNNFVQDSLKGIIFGFIKCLKFTRGAQKLEIQIKGPG